ncbi:MULTISPECIES: SGNH/GDSL hydrolase family protein [Streptomyces]|uniref:SGNH/GDSL hydrolase family protein n=1 Tax=Streptomyces TaxID=1883 RepID=UPI001CC8F4FC|nr:MULTISPECIES: SGNH/GDSL hydrolase family protein [Streptomyces]UBI35478.1 SGNH/GDSL hydrolase family protein [Streptomyces mobaraensis]UKW28070.1 SGNH/GDSL hydrolase family protein [Streptomyces sp. TYQ1024]
MTSKAMTVRETELAGTAAPVGAAARTAWAAGWSAAVQRPSAGFGENWSESGFARQSVRQVVRVTGGGTSVRVRLSHRYGAGPLTVDGAALALSAGGAAVRPESRRALTFGGAASVRIPAGGEVVSDPVELRVAVFDPLALTLYFDGPTGPVTFHSQAWADSYRAAGDRTEDASGTGFDEVTHSWYLLSDIELSGEGAAEGAVVTLGDSITDGFGSSVGANGRYPDALAERLAAAGRPWAVLNAGIGGNLLLHDSPWFGERPSARLDRDVLDKPGVRAVIVHVGLNDIGFSEVDLPMYKPSVEVSAGELIAGYRELIRRARERGLKVIGGTILPFKGSEYHTPRAEAKRVAVNEWIRGSGEFDAVADFAAVLASAEDPEVLSPAYDSGDRKHPGDAGYRVMAEAVDLAAL